MTTNTEIVSLAGVRHVRTAEGADFFNLPIGAPITEAQFAAIKAAKGVDHTKAISKPGEGVKTVVPNSVNHPGYVVPGSPAKIGGQQFGRHVGSPQAPGQRATDQAPQSRLKVIKPTISGPQHFQVGSSSYTAPEGSKLITSRNSSGIVYVLTPDGKVHAFTQAGEVTVPDDLQAHLVSQFRGDLKNDPTFASGEFGTLPQTGEPVTAQHIGAMKPGASVVHKNAAIGSFTKEQDGSWKHDAKGLKVPEQSIKDSADAGNLTAGEHKDALHALATPDDQGKSVDFTSMEKPDFTKSLNDMPTGQTLTIGSVTLTKGDDGQWHHEETNSTISSDNLFFLKSELKAGETPATQDNKPTTPAGEQTPAAPEAPTPTPGAPEVPATPEDTPPTGTDAGTPTYTPVTKLKPGDLITSREQFSQLPSGTKIEYDTPTSQQYFTKSATGMFRKRSGWQNEETKATFDDHEFHGLIIQGRIRVTSIPSADEEKKPDAKAPDVNAPKEKAPNAPEAPKAPEEKAPNAPEAPKPEESGKPTPGNPKLVETPNGTRYALHVDDAQNGDRVYLAEKGQPWTITHVSKDSGGKVSWVRVESLSGTFNSTRRSPQSRVLRPEDFSSIHSIFAGQDHKFEDGREAWPSTPPKEKAPEAPKEKTPSAPEAPAVPTGALPDDHKVALGANGPEVTVAQIKEAITSLEGHSGFQISYGLKALGGDHAFRDENTLDAAKKESGAAFPDLKPKPALVAYLKSLAGISAPNEGKDSKGKEEPTIRIGSENPKLTGVQGHDGGIFTPTDVQGALDILSKFEGKNFKFELNKHNNPLGSLNPNSIVGFDKDKTVTKQRFIDMLKQKLENHANAKPEEKAPEAPKTPEVPKTPDAPKEKAPEVPKTPEAPKEKAPEVPKPEEPGKNESGYTVGQTILGQDHLHLLPHGTKIEYTRKDGRSTEYTVSPQGTIVTNRGTEVEFGNAKRMEFTITHLPADGKTPEQPKAPVAPKEKTPEVPKTPDAPKEKAPEVPKAPETKPEEKTPDAPKAPAAAQPGDTVKTLDELKNAEQGTKIRISDSTYTKTGPDEWKNEASGTTVAHTAFNRFVGTTNLRYAHVPGFSKSGFKEGKQPTDVAELRNAPVGTEIHTPMEPYKKTGADEWTDAHGEVYSSSALGDFIPHMKYAHIPGVSAEKPKETVPTESSYKKDDTLPIDDLPKVEPGTTVQIGGYQTVTRNEDGTWTMGGSTVSRQTADIMNSLKDYYGVDAKVKVTKTPFKPFSEKEMPKEGASLDWDQMERLPIGSVVDFASDSEYNKGGTLSKIGPDKWMTTVDGRTEVFSTDMYRGSAGWRGEKTFKGVPEVSSTIKPGELAVTAEQLNNLPQGSVLTRVDAAGGAGEAYKLGDEWHFTGRYGDKGVFSPEKILGLGAFKLSDAAPLNLGAPATADSAANAKVGTVLINKNNVRSSYIRRESGWANALFPTATLNKFEQEEFDKKVAEGSLLHSPDSNVDLAKKVNKVVSPVDILSAPVGSSFKWVTTRRGKKETFTLIADKNTPGMYRSLQGTKLSGRGSNTATQVSAGELFTAAQKGEVKLAHVARETGVSHQEFKQAIDKATTHKHVTDALRSRFPKMEIPDYSPPSGLSDYGKSDNFDAYKQFADNAGSLLEELPFLQTMRGLTGSNSVSSSSGVLAWVNGGMSQSVDDTVMRYNMKYGAFSLDTAVNSSIKGNHFHGDQKGSAMERIITHEVGHVIDYFTGNEARIVATRVANQYLSDHPDRGDEKGKYARTSPAELWAEMYAEYRVGTHPSDLAKKVVAEVEELIRKKLDDPKFSFPQH